MLTMTRQVDALPPELTTGTGSMPEDTSKAGAGQAPERCRALDRLNLLVYENAVLNTQKAALSTSKMYNFISKAMYTYVCWMSKYK